MATRQRQHQRSDDPLEEDENLFAYESAFDLDDDITDEDIEDFLEEEADKAASEEKKPGFMNLQTGSGLALIAIGTIYLLQQLGFFALPFSMGGFVALLPWLAGILIILTGFGVLSWSPSRRRKRARQKARRRRARQEKTMGRQRSRPTGPTASTGSKAFEQARESARRAAREAERVAGRAASRASQRRSGTKRRLAKSRTNKKIAGVAGGIAEYLGIDPTLVRIAFVIGAVVGSGFSIPLYLILAFVLPKADETEGLVEDDPVIRIVRD